jgi:hypothetical protein
VEIGDIMKYFAVDRDDMVTFLGEHDSESLAWDYCSATGIFPKCVWGVNQAIATAEYIMEYIDESELDLH